MGRPIRIDDPDRVHLITLRTYNAQLFLRPSREAREIVGGVVARYQEMYGIELFACEFLGNHYHMLARAPQGRLWKFAKSVNCEVSRRISRLIGLRGRFWGRRYDDQIVIEPTDEEEALLYVTCNAVNHGLVRHPKDWPGLSCYQQLRTGKAQTFKFTHFSAPTCCQSDSSNSSRPLQTEHTLRLSPLPSLGVSTLQEQFTLIGHLINKRIVEIHKQRRDEGRGFLDKATLLKQNPFDFPFEVSKSDRPLCYTKSQRARALFRDSYRALRDWYCRASFEFRNGNFSVEFPPYTFKPPLHCAV